MPTQQHSGVPAYVNAFMRASIIKPGQTVRGDCPVCGGYNRFQVTQNHMEVMWHCFGAGCNASGRTRTQLTAQSLNDSKSMLDQMFISEKRIHMMNYPLYDEWSTPICEFTQVERFDPRWEWLDKYNCTDAFDDTPVKFRYDKIKDRLVFIEYDEKYEGVSREIMLATGRSMNGALPKWYKYEVKRSFFSSMTVTPKGAVDVFLCEDAPSACSLGRVGLGVALCGTSVNADYLRDFLDARIGLSRIGSIYICLDEDAVRKGMKLAITLSSFHNMPIGQLMLTDDAKNLTFKQLRKQIPQEGKGVPFFKYFDYRGRRYGY